MYTWIVYPQCNLVMGKYFRIVSFAFFLWVFLLSIVKSIGMMDFDYFISIMKSRAFGSLDNLLWHVSFLNEKKTGSSTAWTITITKLIGSMPSTS